MLAASGAAAARNQLAAKTDLQSQWGRHRWPRRPRRMLKRYILNLCDPVESGGSVTSPELPVPQISKALASPPLTSGSLYAIPPHSLCVWGTFLPKAPILRSRKGTRLPPARVAGVSCDLCKIHSAHKVSFDFALNLHSCSGKVPGSQSTAGWSTLSLGELQALCWTHGAFHVLARR